MTNPIHTSLKVTICADANDAIAKGYNYAAGKSVKPIEVKNVVVIRDGTENGNATVDFILEDGSGQKFCFMITGALLKSIPC